MDKLANILFTFKVFSNEVHSGYVKTVYLRLLENKFGLPNPKKQCKITGFTFTS